MTMNEIHKGLMDKQQADLVEIKTQKQTFRNIEDIIISATEKIAYPVLATLGADGKYHAFNEQDVFGNVNPTITNDGVTVAQSLFPFEDARENLIARYIHAAANKTALVAGDGTTTTVAAITSMVNNLVGKVENPYAVERGINLAVERAEAYINKHKKKVNLKQLWKIAYTSSHGNKEVADNIMDVYKDLKGNWDIDISFEDGDYKDRLDIKEGYRIALKSPSIVDKVPPKIMAPRLILFNDKLSDFGILTKNIHIRSIRDSSPVIFIVKDITQEMINITKEMKQSYPSDIFIVKVDTFGHEVIKQFKDILYLATAQEFSDGSIEAGNPDKMILDNAKKTHVIPNVPNGDIPENHPAFPYYEIKIKSALLTAEDCIFDFNTPKAAVDKYLQGLLEEGKALQDKELQWLHQKRMDRIKAISCTYFVGGNSNEDIKTKTFLVEDALKACRSAVRRGYVIGGGKFSYDLVKHLNSLYVEDGEVRKGYEATLQALSYSLQVMCNFAQIDCDEVRKSYENDVVYNFALKRYENLKETTVLDSAATHLEVLHNSTGVIKHFIKTHTLTV